jgi:hypothetical protein
MKILVLASLVLSALSSFAAPAFTGESSLRVIEINGRKQLEKIETRFFEDNYKQELYKFTSKTLSYMDADGAEQSGVIEVYKSKNSLFDTQAWSINVQGAEFSLFNDELVQVNEFGCCDSPTINRFFSRENGALVEAAQDGSTIQVEVPNTGLKMRYMAVVKDSKAPRKLGSKSYVGTISYFDGKDIIDRVRVYADMPKGWGADLRDLKTIVSGKNEKRNDILTLWEADGVKNPSLAFSNFGFDGSIYVDGDVETFKILVAGDKFDRALSKGSAGLELIFK